MKKKIRIIAVIATITILSVAVNSKAVNISAIYMGLQRAIAIQQLGAEQDLPTDPEPEPVPTAFGVEDTTIAWNEETQSYDMEINITTANIEDNTEISISIEAYDSKELKIETGISYKISGNTIKENSAVIKINASGENVTDVLKFTVKMTCSEIKEMEVTLKTRLSPKIELGDITVKSGNMPEDVIQIITAQVVTEDIPDNSTLNVKLVKDGVDIDTTKYAVEGNTVSRDMANITIKAGPEITVGNYTLFLTYLYKNGEIDSSVTAQKDFSIKTIEMNKITLNQTELTMEVGDSQILTYKIIPSSFTDDDIEFSSENTDVATFTAGGVLKAVGRGETTVKIASKDGKVSATCHVVVLNPSVEIGITKRPRKWMQGEEGTINVQVITVDLQNSTKLDLKITKNEKDVTNLFTITGNEIQNNEANLVITLNKENAISGEYTLTVTFDGKQIKSENLEKQTRTFKIEANTAVTSIKADKTDIKMIPDATTKINVTIEPADAENKKLIWTTSNDQVAVVDEDGTITALSKGKAVITVCSDENREIKASINVTVQDILQTEEYKVDLEKKLLKAVPTNTTVKTLLENIQIGSDTYSFIDESGKTLKEEDLVGTDTTLKIDEEEFKIIVTGDINGDGKLSATDLSKLKCHIIDLEILLGNKLVAADLNEDGLINLTDLSNLKKLLVGLEV